MRERAISAAAIAVVVIIVFLLGQPWLTLGIAALALLAAIEVFRLLPQAGFPVGLLPGAAFAPVAVLAVGWPELDLLDEEGGLAAAIAVFVALVIVLTAIEGFRRPDPRDGFLAWLGGSFGSLYPALLAFVVAILVVAPPVPEDAPLREVLPLDAGRSWLLVLVLTVWSFDTFAYLSGRTFRRGRFLAHISPNKTWSGVIGGSLAAVIVAGVLTWSVGEWLPGGLLLGLLVAVAGQAGDLAESMLKRAAGAKDSGNLLPGHGGMLDRVDSFLFAAPVVFAYLVVVAAT